MYQNLVRVAAAVPLVKVADCKVNSERILGLIRQADSAGVEIVCFPELSVTAYTCADLFLKSSFVAQAERALAFLLSQTEDLNIVSIVGLPVAADNRLFNCAVAFQRGKILGVVPKSYLPNSNEFYEYRWFASGLGLAPKDITLAGQQCCLCANTLFRSRELSFSIEICQDLWAVVPPSSKQALEGSHIIFNLSASDELAGKNDYRRTLVAQHSGRCNAGYVYASAGFGESSTDVLFASSAIIAENGVILAESNRFSFDQQLVITEIDIERLRNDRLHNDSFKNYVSEANLWRVHSFEIKEIGSLDLTREVSKHPFVPAGDKLDERCCEIFDIQSNALAIRLANTGIDKAVIGISGGLDSSLALMVTVEAFDKLSIPRSNIIGITMPGFGTTSRTEDNSMALMESLGISARRISIEKAVMQHFVDIGHNKDIHDTTYENSQARERTQILMDVANKEGALVVGTGDMSELALGWCTYNGDHISMYGVNSGVPKTLVRHLVEWAARCKSDGQTAKIILDVLDTPISPELLPHSNDSISQKTEDIVGPYELHDFFLYHFLRFGYNADKMLLFAKKSFENDYSVENIKKWLNVFLSRFFSQQFKRSCMPDGVKVGNIDLSPRGSLRMASDIRLCGGMCGFKK